MRVYIWKKLPVILGILFVSIFSILYFYFKGETVELGKEVQHPNGLIVRAPVGCDVQEIEGKGYQICTGRRSSPLIVEVEKTPAVKFSEMKKRGEAYYKTSFSEGVGSGGDEYSIFAARQAGDKWIVMRRQKQSELGHPGFDMEWAVFLAARLDAGTRGK